MNRATFICGGELVPASRFRVHPVAGALAGEGWKTEIIHGYGQHDQKLRSVARRAYRAACRIRRAVQTALLETEGPILVQRLALPWLGLPEVMLGKRSGKLVFDFDDAVFLGANGRENTFRRGALAATFANASHVVAGNSWLAQHVPGNVAVTVIPTCIDTSLYAPAALPKQWPNVKLGWIGTSGNFPYLRQLKRPLAELRRRGHRFEFQICSDVLDAALFNELGASFEKWTAEGELAFLQSLDVGLMPLAEDDWCRGKCSFKMIQYMAVGCPVVASAVGMNNDVLADDVGGRLVRDGDWVSALDSLLRSADARAEAGHAARARAVAQYDIRSAVTQYRRIFQTLQ